MYHNLETEILDLIERRPGLNRQAIPYCVGDIPPHIDGATTYVAYAAGRAFSQHITKVNAVVCYLIEQELINLRHGGLYICHKRKKKAS